MGEDAKIKIRDLAAELNVGTKELLNQLRDMNIPVKSLSSALTDDQAALVRSHFSGGQQAGEVMRRETQSGVIVRRRSRPRPGQEGVADEPVAAAPAAPEAPAPAAKAEPEVQAKPQPRPARAPRPATPAARIISEPAKPVQEPVVVAAPPQPEPEAPVAPAPVVVEPAPEPVVVKPAPEPTPVVEAPAAPAPQVQPPVPETPTIRPARIVRPDEGQRTVRVFAHAGAQEAQPDSKEGEREQPREPEDRRRPPQREEKFGGSQVRVISKPEEAPRPRAPRPGGPVNLGGPSAPRLERPGAPTFRPAGSTGPSFRPAGSVGPGGPGGPGGQRPSGPGGFRPAGPGGFGGPRPSSPRPGEMPPPSSEDRSRKRRGPKDRRVVEFGGDADDRRGGARRTTGETDDGRPMRGRPRKSKKGGRMDELPTGTAPMKAAKRKIKVDEAIRVSDMAHQMGVKSPEIIRVLMGLGIMATINKALDIETATVVASEFGYEVEKVGFAEEDFIPATTETPDSDEQLLPRPPVVTIMGHVDHGKTSLLDAIRSAKVAEGEAGGITQHIGAYHVETGRGEVVFLDTPGHEAFTAMRARGAKVTDLVVLVVAADDGVMEQTREAVNHSKAAGVPIVVAVNKMDKEGADPDRVKRELADMGLSPEEWGGETIYSYVSAKKRMGLDELLEMILLQAEVLDLKANPNKPARGHIVEAKLDKGRGPIGTVLVQEGTLRLGDSFVCGLHFGKVRAMFDDQGRKIKEAGPAMPVEVQGFDGIPDAGDEFSAVADEKVARRIAETRQAKQRERELAKESKVTLETFLQSKKDGEVKSLAVILKADVQGSQEAITEALSKQSTDKVKINIIHAGTGAITESDILLATASQAIIVGFNVRATAKIREIAEREKVEIRYYDIIYKLVEDIRDAMTGMLAPVVSEEYLGQAEVRQTFSVPKVGTVAGSFVVDGKLTRQASVRLLRDSVVIYTGKLSSLKRFKDDVREVAKGYECGVGLDNFNDIKVGDIIEAFEMKETKATL